MGVIRCEIRSGSMLEVEVSRWDMGGGSFEVGDGIKVGCWKQM